MRRQPAQPQAVLDLFRPQLSETDLTTLADLGTEFRCPARWPLVVEGTPADELYLIGEGTADVYRRRRRVARVGPGQVVGEMAFWSTKLRSATVSAATGLHGIRVPFERVPELLDRSHGLSSMILDTALERGATTPLPESPLPESKMRQPK